MVSLDWDWHQEGHFEILEMLFVPGLHLPTPTVADLGHLTFKFGVRGRKLKLLMLTRLVKAVSGSKHCRRLMVVTKPPHLIR